MLCTFAAAYVVQDSRSRIKFAVYAKICGTSRATTCDQGGREVFSIGLDHVELVRAYRRYLLDISTDN